MQSKQRLLPKPGLTLLSRGADRVAAALAASRLPVGALAQATANGWVAD